jgi:CubicO group peptidase (beta-lactamase class C family)
MRTDARFQALEAIAPEQAGLSALGLARVESRLDRDIQQGVLPGAVAVVYRHGRIAWTYCGGVLDPACAEPMRLDAIFRIYSMTKPLVSIAVLVLWEEGLLQLDDPISRYLPMSADPQVGGPGQPGSPARETTIYDLMRHTGGLADFLRGAEAFRDLYRQAGLRSFDHTAAAYGRTSEDLVEVLAKLPLAYQPGTVWEYGLGGDVLGRLVEVVAGASLDAVLAARVCGPLGLTDTGFHVPPDRANRAAQPSSASHSDVSLQTLVRPPDYLSGGSGCYSSLSDYLTFARMLLGLGSFEGGRLLSRKSVELMTADHLGDDILHGPDYIPGDGYGFGLGVAVRRACGGSAVAGSAGDYWWLGRAGTSFFVDPREQLIGILMMQKYWQARAYQKIFKNLIYQAIDD